MCKTVEPQPVAWAFFSHHGYEHFLEKGDRGFINEISVIPEFVERKSKEHGVTVALYSHATVEALRSERDALREALERIACRSQDTDLLWWQVEARAALASTGDRT